MAESGDFEPFYRVHLARIVRACTLVTTDRDLAEEVAAESFARLWSRWRAIQGPDHAGGYVYKTAMRLCARELRRRRPFLKPLAESRTGADEALERHEIVKALRHLPLRQRQAVVLRDWLGFETVEVARLLHIRESTVRVHLARGRHHLRQSLPAEER